MSNNGISFTVQGPDAESAAEELKKILREEFDFESHIIPEKQEYKDGSTKAIDPISLISLLIGIPGTILAVTDLVSRAVKKKKLDNTLEKINSQIVQKKEVTIKVTYPDGTIKEITRVDSVEILDSLPKLK